MAQPRVLLYAPKYKSNGPFAKDFYRVKLMLYHPFKAIKNLLMVDGVRSDIYQVVYTFCQACQGANNNCHPYDYYKIKIMPNNYDKFED